MYHREVIRRRSNGWYEVDHLAIASSLGKRFLKRIGNRWLRHEMKRRTRQALGDHLAHHPTHQVAKRTVGFFF